MRIWSILLKKCLMENIFWLAFFPWRLQRIKSSLRNIFSVDVIKSTVMSVVPIQITSYSVCFTNFSQDLAVLPEF